MHSLSMKSQITEIFKSTFLNVPSIEWKKNKKESWQTGLNPNKRLKKN